MYKFIKSSLVSSFCYFSHTISFHMMYMLYTKKNVFAIATVCVNVILHGNLFPKLSLSDEKRKGST